MDVDMDMEELKPDIYDAAASAGRERIIKKQQ